MGLDNLLMHGIDIPNSEYHLHIQTIRQDQPLAKPEYLYLYSDFSYTFIIYFRIPSNRLEKLGV